MDTMQQQLTDFDDDDSYHGHFRADEMDRRQRRSDIRRGIDDYFERKTLNRLDNWYDYD